MKTTTYRFVFTIASALTIASCGGGGDSGGGGGNTNTTSFSSTDVYQSWEVPPIGGEHMELTNDFMTGVVDGRSIYSGALVYETNSDGTLNGNFGGAIYSSSSSDTDWSFGTVQASLTSSTSISATFSFSSGTSITKDFVVASTTKNQYGATTYSIAGMWSDLGTQLTFDSAGNWTAIDTTFGCSITGTYSTSAPNSPVYRIQSTVYGSGCYFIGPYASVPYEGTAIIMDIDGQPHLYIMQVQSLLVTVGPSSSPYWLAYIGR